MINLLDEKENFYGKDKKPFLVRCPSCHLENYLPNVATGQCSWCGWSEEAEEKAIDLHKESN